MLTYINKHSTMKTLIVSLVFSLSFVFTFSQHEKKNEGQNFLLKTTILFSKETFCEDFISKFKNQNIAQKAKHQITDMSIEDIYWLLENVFYYKTQPELLSQKRIKRINF